MRRVSAVLALGEEGGPRCSFVFINHSRCGCVISSASTGGGRRNRSPEQRLMLCLSHLQGQPGPAGPLGPPGADGVKASLHSNCGLLTPKWATAIKWFSQRFFKATFSSCLSTLNRYATASLRSGCLTFDLCLNYRVVKVTKDLPEALETKETK